MNASTNLWNPYIAGPPVYGENFYGRSKELREAFDGTKKFIWFISTRRMGKTSLISQIAYLCQHKPPYNEQYRCLRWDLQGNPNLKRLRKKLTLRINQTLIPEIDFRSLESNQSCAQVIELCTEAVSQKGLTLLLLIDEPDVFLELAENGEADFLDELNDSLQLQGIRTVITSTYRLDRLASMNQFLAQFEPFFISLFDPEEGKALICQTNIFDHPPPFVRDEEVISEILNNANYSPFFIQKICGYLYPDKDIARIRDKIFDLRELDPYFTSDFSGLEDTEKAILYFMINKKEKGLSASEILSGGKGLMDERIESPLTQDNIEVMTSLNILRHENHKNFVASPFFRRWLIRNKKTLFQGVIRRTDIPLTPSIGERLTRDDLMKIIAEIKALIGNLNTLEKKYEQGMDAAQYFRMRLNHLKQRELAIEKLNNFLRGKGAGALADVVDMSSISQDDQELLAELEQVAKRGENERWGIIIYESLENRRAPIVQIILTIAFKVASTLV